MKKEQTKEELRSKQRWSVAGIIALLAVAGFFVAPGSVNRVLSAVNDTVHLGLPLIPAKPFALGLDLQGGAHLVYEANTSAIPQEERNTAVEGVRDVIERRVNGLGVGEPNVQTAQVDDVYRVIVELPGITDIKNAIAMIGGTPILEFKEENDAPPQDLTEEQQQKLKTYNDNARARAEAALARVQQGESLEAIAQEVSEDERSRNNGGYIGYINERTAPDLYAWAETAAPGDVSENMVESVDGFNILRLGEERDGQKKVSVRHILVCYTGSACVGEVPFSKDEAREEAQQLFEQANAANFSELAKKYSHDPNSNEAGGMVPPFGREEMLPSFEEAAFDAQVGQIVGPVETELGYHIIYKEDEFFEKEYELWRILIERRSPSDIVPPQELWKPTGLSGKQLKRAEVLTDPTSGQIQVGLQFNDEGRDLFRQITERNVGIPVAIFLDGAIISAPTVQQVIVDGQAVISGNFGIQEARLLAQRLNAGALPVPVELVSQQTVGATLGAKTFSQSVKAGVVGVVIVMIFMLLYYRLPGALAVVSLSLYMLITLALFKLIGVTLTLAGIAGFILSIGMAVDANILIFERLKEELRGGRRLRVAIEEGFVRAWTSIRDGNVSTLITCALLIWFGSSFVQGFAVTLFIGILVSMFTAITVTRVLLRFVAPWFLNKSEWLFLGNTQKK